MNDGKANARTQFPLMHLLIEKGRELMGKENFGGINTAGANTNVQPIVCDPQYVLHDSFVPRYIPVVHPVIHVNRQNIVNVPQHSVQQSQQTQIVDPGLPGRHQACQWCKCPPRPNCWW